ncbi:hypothetical protein SODALDRAFT_149690 [Sodiomyces alkalinus F11]|uniref:Uncharacterized protein n=1 Tax=Sodiomyces alkalinus (strain CBS 110278 / VKM F-3762 / F11) TaxID=1314773 RepID=A0A3N2PWX0_SODAK|nr:hypothetical protein SODALDRAFT_149690 [Sodiomyces alkalinus F11]ROT38972.1 hypothetical protein SODALDRAFT_149690 [Sodiomyces alkalinus F11]
MERRLMRSTAIEDHHGRSLFFVGYLLSVPAYLGVAGIFPTSLRCDFWPMVLAPSQQTDLRYKSQSFVGNSATSLLICMQFVV